MRLELTAFRLWDWRAAYCATEARWATHKKFVGQSKVCVTHGGTRTPNLRFRRPTPYPLGHAGIDTMSVKLGFSYHAKHTARLAQSVEHETLNLRVVGSSPTLGEQFFSPPTFLVRRQNCRDPGSNRGPLDLQSNALPTELSRLWCSTTVVVFCWLIK